MTMKKPLQTFNHLIYRCEKAVAGVLFLLMALLMFVSVVHRIFSRKEGRVVTLIAGALDGMGISVDTVLMSGSISSAISLLIAFTLAYGGLRTLKRATPIPRVQAAALAIGITAALTVVLKIFLAMFPNGIVRGPVMSLCCMLWVGFLGASTATYERRHLALEMGDKIWPQSWLPQVRRLAMLLTALFCLFLLSLSVISILDHHKGWMVNHLAGNLLPTEIPKWVIFLIFPYTFMTMTLRFLGAMITGKTAGEELLPGLSLPSAEEEAL